MEFLITAVWGGVFLLLFIAFKVMNRYKAKKSALKLPPGPKPLPIIGNMHQLLGSSNTHHVLRDLSKRYGSLVHLQLGEVSTLIVSSAEAAEQVMKTHDTIFSYRPRLLYFRILNYDCTDIAFSPYGDYWRQLRKICMIELLSSKRVQSFRSIREEEVLNLIREISLHKSESVNLSRKIFSFTSGLVSRTAFGKKGTYQEEFVSVLEEAKVVTAGFSIADMYPSIKFIQVISEMNPKLKRLQKTTDRILQNILDEHKEQKMKKKPSYGESKEDLVDVLLNVQESDDFGAPFTDSNIKAVIMDMFSAGTDTAATTIEWAISEMLKNPKVMKRAQDEVREIFKEKGNIDESDLHKLKYLEAVIKETLRLHAPAPLLLPRECSENCKINNFWCGKKDMSRRIICCSKYGTSTCPITVPF